MTRWLALCLVALTLPASAQEAEAPMTYERLGRIVFALDPEAEPQGPGFTMRIGGVLILVVTDQPADRMRAMSPIRPAEGLTQADLERMMQANFDSALDARYAIANGTLWSVFIHALSPFERDEFISGLGQVANVAQSYGTLYSGGALQFGGGDSGGLQRQLLDELLKKGEDL